MSMENAILELASAIRYAADRFNGTGASLAMINASKAVSAPVDPLADLKEAGKTNPELKAAADELEQAVQKVEADAQAEKAAPAKKNVQAEPSPAEPAAQTTSAPAAPSDAAPLDYKKDVVPVLLKVHKTKGADALLGILKKYMPDEKAPKGDKLTAEQLPLALADANKLLAS